MGYKPKKWPSYALDALEDSVALTLEIERLGRMAQQAIADGDRMLAAIIYSDIRQKSALIREKLIRAKNGDYSRED